MSNREEPQKLKLISEYAKIRPASIYAAIRNGRLKAAKIGARWYVTKQEIDEYRIRRHSGDLRRVKGHSLFSLEEGKYSIQQSAKILSEHFKRRCAPQHVYYLVRRGYLKAHRIGGAWVILKEHLEQYAESEQKRRINSHPDQLRFA